ncbi:pro-epidermal growth factor-like [Dendronephthya gigantea]|uniref:pro-epidermal growth factor-like n=1 Tax=Dendronephthya gigantea TaxID=151771 RepID=UPI00106A01F9|nr:pro-epidermal growth factor-like [Dendronephthya gigantea]XP_028416146.1 pro-epidermal growth factor-like [Dendronephthya gigantea]
MTKMAFVSTKILFALTILMYFGGTLINCNEDIPICDKQLKQLKEEVKNWERRCVNESLGNLDEVKNKRRRENNSPGCTAEKEYFQARMRMHSQMCFYDEPYPEQYMFLANETAILAIDLITLDTRVVVDGKRNIGTLGIDLEEKKIYFAEYEKEIRRANFDGTYEEIIVNDAEAWLLTIDWIGRRILWTKYFKQTINVVTLEGKDNRTLSKTSKARDVAIDPVEGYLFWTGRDGEKIMRRHLATNNEKQIYGFNRYENYVLALDYKRKRIYAFEEIEEANVIIEMNYDGRDRNHTTNYGSSGFGGRLSVDVIGDFLYWKERNSPIIIKMNVTSRDISRYIPVPKGFTVRKLLVVDKDRQPEGKCTKISCLHGHCSNTNGTEVCHCDKGFKYNGRSCKDIDECVPSPCNLTGLERSCNNTPGSYICMCKNGSTFKEGSCAANSELKIRLNGSSNNMSGRVEIYHPTLGWGKVCDRHDNGDLTTTEGKVICRQLGFSGVTSITSDYRFGDGSGPVFLSNVQCSGDEAFIWDCSHNGWNNNPGDCEDSRGVVVDCN